MKKNIAHIGIAVKDMDTAIEQYTTLLGVKPYHTETVASEQVNTAFFKTGDTDIELLEATSEDSPIARFLEKRGEGVHHIAYAVSDIRAEMERLRQAGFRLLQEEPRRGAGNKLVCFIHPKSARGVLTELCQM